MKNKTKEWNDQLNKYQVHFGHWIVILWEKKVKMKTNEVPEGCGCDMGDGYFGNNAPNIHWHYN